MGVSRAISAILGRLVGSLPQTHAACAFWMLAVAQIGCDDLKSRQLAKEGNDFYKHGEFQKAVEKYDESLKLNPVLTKVWVNRAYACQQQFTPGVKSPQNDKIADCLIESLEKALALDPKRKDLNNLRIQAWIDSARYELALGYFDKLLEKDPKDVESVKAKAAVLMRAGRFDEGLKLYYRRVELEPKNPEALYAIGVMLWERLHDHEEITGEERRKLADDALAPLKKALEINSNYVEAMTYTNLLYRERALGWDRNASDEENQGALADLKQADEWQKKALDLLKRAAEASKDQENGSKDPKEKGQKAKQGKAEKE